MIRAGNEYYGLELHDRDMIMLGAYGGGIQTGNTCGAILAAAAILSMKYVEQKAHDSKDIKPAVNLLMRRIHEALGSTLCKDIKAKVFQPEVRCKVCVETVCDIIEQVLVDYEAEKTAKAE